MLVKLFLKRKTSWMMHLNFQNFLQSEIKFFTIFWIRRARSLMFLKKKQKRLVTTKIYIQWIRDHSFTQTFIGKFTKLSKIDFSMKCFTANCMWFSSTNGYSLSNPSDLSIYLKSSNIQKSKVLSHSETRETTRSFIFFW